MKHYSSIEIGSECSILTFRESSHRMMIEEISTSVCFTLLKKPAFVDTIVVRAQTTQLTDKGGFIIEELKASLKLGFLKVRTLRIPYFNLEDFDDSFVHWIKSSDFPFSEFECGLKANFNEAFLVDLMKTPNLKFETIHLLIIDYSLRVDNAGLIRRVIENATPCFLNEVNVSYISMETNRFMKQFAKKLKLQKLLLVMVIPKMLRASKSPLRKMPVDLLRMLIAFLI